MRRIVLIGNCQIDALGGLYRRFVVPSTQDKVDYVPSYAPLDQASRAAIQNADLIVEQLFDVEQKATTSGLAETTPRRFVPTVTAAFLWPYANQAHPHNPSDPYLPSGPYGGESSDSYLNRLILAGRDPEDAVAEYTDLDIAGRMKLDRLFELVMDRQKARDRAAGYQMAAVIEQYFRREPLFRIRIIPVCG